jgi:signal transduction histidine kinase
MDAGRRDGALEPTPTSRRWRLQRKLPTLERWDLAVRPRLATARAGGLAIARAERQERARLSAVLHDDVQQVLAAARLHASFGGADASLIALLDDAIEATRGLAHALRPIDADEPFDAALERVVRLFRTRHRQDVVLDVRGVPALDPVVADVGLTTLRELLFNAVRHAAGASVAVRLDVRRHWARLVVEDRGEGYDSDGVHRGSGLDALRRRLLSVGAVLDGWSSPSGTTAVLLLPLARRAGTREDAGDHGEAFLRA